MPVNSAPCSVWKVDKTFPSVFGQGRDLIDSILAVMGEKGWNDRDIFAVNMALEESITNAIEHGNHCNPEKKFHVVCHVSNDLVFISVADEGKGFKRELVPNPLSEEIIDSPSGRGVLLISGFMTRVWYNEAGNEIFMEKVPS